MFRPNHSQRTKSKSHEKDPRLGAYKNCVAPEGLVLGSYVEHGACLLSQGEIGQPSA